MTDPLSELLDSERFQRVIGGRGSTADEAAVQQAAAEAGINASDITQLRMLVEKSVLWRQVALKTGLDPELIWKRQVRASTNTDETVVPVFTESLRRGRRVPWWIGVAATVVLFVGIWGAQQLAHHGSGPIHVVAAQVGQRVQYRLPDGTRVLLAPASKMTFGDWSATGPREVTLEGEAYFDVKHDEARPFRVRVHDAIVEDLGTEFVIRAYARDATPVVAVRSGLVAVRPRSGPVTNGVILTPGDVAHVDPRGFATKIAADTSVWFGWMRGELVFRDVPMADVLRQLQRWYDIDVSANSAILAIQVTLSITERSTSAEAVAYVADIVNARVERRGAAFILTSEAR